MCSPFLLFRDNHLTGSSSTHPSTYCNLISMLTSPGKCSHDLHSRTNPLVSHSALDPILSLNLFSSPVSLMNPLPSLPHVLVPSSQQKPVSQESCCSCNLEHSAYIVSIIEMKQAWRRVWNGQEINANEEMMKRGSCWNDDSPEIF